MRRSEAKFGWRGRVGLIVPSSNSTLEPEMKAMCPSGVEIYATRVAFTADEQGLKDMRRHVRRAARDLASEGLSDIIVFGCTVGSMIEGQGYDEQICAEITAETGLPAIATTTAVMAALHALGAVRVAVATPYTKRINEIEAKALRSYGVNVVRMKGYHEDVPDATFTNRMIGDLDEQDTYAFSRSVDCAEAQCLFISCTNFRTIGIIGRLERDLGKPVLSSNLCTAWLALERLHVGYRKDELAASGCDCRLFRTLAS
jgi:maleate isomerase